MTVEMNAKGGSGAGIAAFLFAAGAGIILIAVSQAIRRRNAGASSFIKSGARSS